MSSVINCQVETAEDIDNLTSDQLCESGAGFPSIILRDQKQEKEDAQIIKD